MRKRVEWTPQARGDIRRIEQRTALDLLGGLADYTINGYGDVERLTGIQPPELRPRLGD